MRKKVLKATSPEKCIGCELCVYAAQRLCGKAGVEGAPIKILGSVKGFNIRLEPEVQNLDVKKISEICPRACFSVEEMDVKDESGPEFER